jgi:hypothetical protein
MRPLNLLVILLAGAVAACGCGQAMHPLPFMAKPAQPPQILSCHDAVGHIKGNKPWILGGACCCTPTQANYALHVEQGTIDRSMTYEAYLALYKGRGIATDLDHKGCGNLCAQGPHVVLGGRCMATPTPGRGFYEQVTYGPHTPLVGGATASQEAVGAGPPVPNER